MFVDVNYVCPNAEYSDVGDEKGCGLPSLSLKEFRLSVNKFAIFVQPLSMPYSSRANISFPDNLG